MNHTDRQRRMITGALLWGGIALAGLGAISTPAHASPSADVTVTDLQPQSPGARVGFDPQPDPPGVRSGFDPQPEPPVRVAR